MTQSPFIAAINQLCDEKGLPREAVIETIEAALAAAYRKEYGSARQIIKCKLNEDDLVKSKILQIYRVVPDEEFEDEANQIKLTDAIKEKKTIKVEDEIERPLPSKADFGRIAAQTAKQVIIQRLQEVERNILYKEFSDKQGQLLNGLVQQIERDNVIVNLGKINAIMPASEQIPNEHYIIGQRLKVYVLKVEESSRGPRVVVSRANPNFIKILFALEVPEIAAETVEIKGISREPGSRSKISVIAKQEGLDPVGSCVGQRGIRVQSVLAEIGNEKVDIILYNDVTESYIANALSPAKIIKIKLNKKKKQAKVIVAVDQLSLAIGKNGQNVRLASKLTGWGIDIEKSVEKKEKDNLKEKDDKSDDNKDKSNKDTKEISNKNENMTDSSSELKKTEKEKTTKSSKKQKKTKKEKK